MKVKELITQLLEFDMDAEVKIAQHYNDPKPTSGGLELDGKLYDINGLEDVTNTCSYIETDVAIDPYEDIKEEMKISRRKIHEIRARD